MNTIKRNVQNQAVGLIPILLFMFLDNFFSYRLSFFIAVVFCIFCLGLYRMLSKDKIYQFLLLPASATLILYVLFILLKLDPVLFGYSPVLVEVLFVMVLAIIGFSKHSMLRRIRQSKAPAYKRTLMRTALNEFYFLVPLVQNLYTLHLFVILFFTFLPESMQNPHFEHFLYRYLGIVIGVAIIVYEQIRISWMQGSLKKEMWLPVLDDKGKVIGCIARSVSRTSPKKYYHPIVRIAVIYNGMLYLVKRPKTDYVSPETLDYPLHAYILFRHTIENTIKEIIGRHIGKPIEPRFLIRYTHEDEKVKHLVSLHAICVRDEATMKKLMHTHGKLWTMKQIEENIGKGVFSSYFESEYPYLKNTVLFAENYNLNATKKETPLPEKQEN
ncbi:hypothetical protein M2480_000018 [Parabacteroides sp. PFB2-12]|uniref:hypothetical protein n=1 Tax=unclassified Parabacteroides TaxID=2649774 RepID=UPI0024744A14|nr:MULTISPECIES: hypothetical protein [unclassified Parabacteroides]MDH6341268.1 hypothetical protein [Parabacteroides sp. PM6-13]MDH6389060.1 hypothetical protein [Parabacteroides sp. PFB2-12]